MISAQACLRSLPVTDPRFVLKLMDSLLERRSRNRR